MSIFHSTHDDKDLSLVVVPPAPCYPQTSIRILRLTEVIDRVGLCRASIYQYIATGSFPKQIVLGQRSVGWLEHEIDTWLSVRVAARAKGGDLTSD
ncbi:MAG: AlpA family transcriptional regulator [Alphaproteobacteria bacterium]